MNIRRTVLSVTLGFIAWPGASAATCIPRYMDCDSNSPGSGSSLVGFLIVIGAFVALGLIKAVAGAAPLLPKWLHIVVTGAFALGLAAFFLGILFVAYFAFQRGEWVMFGFLALMIFGGLREFIRDYL